MVEWFVEFGIMVWDWFGEEDHQNRVTAIFAALAVIVPVIGATLGVLWYLLKYIFGKSDQTPEPIPEPILPTGDLLSMDQHLAILEKREERLKAQLASAHNEEKAQLTAQINELRSQISNPEKSLAEAQKRIAHLEILLARAGNEISAERLAEARIALERGDFSKADAIFAEIEAREEIAVQNAARAAYGRGEIAEGEVRWADAAVHYQRAARLNPCYETLSKAHEFTHWSGDFQLAEILGRKNIDASEEEGIPENLAMAKNDYALTLYELGRLDEAETLFHEALEIDCTTIGDQHPDFAIHLNSLVVVLHAQGRLKEAEKLYRQAIKIDRGTIGERHPDYAIHLNNLSGIVQAQGRFEEAEELCNQSLDIGRATIGEAHPHYAIRLHNLALVVKARGRIDEAEELFKQALSIFRAALPPEHPHISSVEKHLAALPN
ncbi:MAG: tetratricopeptide repeat protein [Rhodobacteraceae bacterium]|nr:tetratricopeptide repeat protein [Paracoccaceae bacterium]